MSEPLDVPVTTPPTPPPANQEFQAITDILGKLSETVTNLDQKLNGMEEIVNGIANPTPEPEPEPEWKPKTWDEFPKLAEEVAKKTFTQIEQERQAKLQEEQQKHADIQAQIDKDFDEQLSKLEKDGVIPPVANPADPNDKGKQVRKELFALGIKYGSPDLVAMANLRNDYVQAGYSFDPKEGKLIKSNPSPFGANAPVGSSSRNAGIPSKPTYKEIHSLSMDEMLRRANT